MKNQQWQDNQFIKIPELSLICVRKHIKEQKIVFTLTQPHEQKDSSRISSIQR
jgi:hypothetical protein